MPLKLDHIGLVVEDIKKAGDIFEAIGLEGGTKAVPDPIQKVTASFITVGKEDGVYIELLEPTSDDSPISNFLEKKGGGLHHLCFEVEDIEQAVNELNDKGFRVVSRAVDCAAYDENLKRTCQSPTKIAFVIISKGILIELIEKGR